MNAIKLYEEYISSQSKKSDQLNESPILADLLTSLTTHPEIGPAEIASHLTRAVKHLAVKHLGIHHPAIKKLDDAHKTLNTYMAKKIGRIAPNIISKI
jgi:hypothetical protein